MTPDTPDPDDTSPVTRAAEALRVYYDALAVRGDIPRTRFRKSTPDRPCEVIR